MLRAALVAVLLSGLAWSAAGCAGQQAEDPQSALHGYARALEEGRADDAYRLLSDEARRGVSLEAFRRMVKDSPEEVREIGRGLSRPPSAPVVTATATIFQCLAFWMSGAAVLAEEFFEMFMMVAYYPEHPFGFAVRLLLLTVFPAGFVAMMPAQVVREANPLKLAACAAAAAIYAGLAWLAFERGLRRYTSGSRLLELR